MEEKDIEKIKLLGRYEFALKKMNITMIVSSIIFFIAGIVYMISKPKIIWCGLMLIGFSIFILIYCFLLRKYLIKKITTLKNELNMK